MTLKPALADTFYLKQCLEKLTIQLPSTIHSDHSKNLLLDLKAIAHGYLPTSKNLNIFYKFKSQGLTKPKNQILKHFFDHGLIERSWLVASSSTQPYLSEMQIKRHQSGLFLTNKNIEDCVILVELPTVIIAESMSFQGFRIWYHSNIKTPSLFKKSYQDCDFSNHYDHFQIYEHDDTTEIKLKEWLEMQANLEISKPTGLF